jgi:predicted aspartyl protease
MLTFAPALLLGLAYAPLPPAEDPKARTVFPQGSSVVELPARFVDGDIIVRLAIEGRDFDFVLDSGASSIVLDDEVARDLALATEPPAAGSLPEPGGATPVDVPAMAIGGLMLHDVVASALPFAYEAKDHTKIAGLLGYDFLAGAVVHVDYRHQRAFAIAPSAFDPAIPGATSVPVSLEDGVPMVSARVGAGFGRRFIVDSGADDVYLFNEFARTHAGDVTDRRGARTQFSSLAYLDSDGAPARMPLIAVDVDDFIFAGVDFHDFLAYRAAGAGDDENVDADGLIGYRFLRYYDVYFDYPAARLVMLPNDLVPHATGR